ncbi:MAG: protein kinase domain-containing protein [Gammaproteobacteria bacterium]
MTEQPGPDVAAHLAGCQGSALGEDRQGGDAFHSAGTLLQGRFELIECVGAGGTSTVYKALDRRQPAVDALDRYIAVKVLNPRFRADPRRLAALQHEVKRYRGLVHPNLVRIYEFYRDDSTAYLTMEYLRGEPLTARIRSESFSGMSASEALPIINSVGQALAHAHSRGIVHCDFKPANVFLTKAGEVKLIDFWLARPFAPHRGEEKPARVGAISPAYASPEMLEGQEPDPRDDVYSLACTAYELLTGVHPFGYRSAIEAREAGLTVERRKGLSHGQWKALCRALAFDRAQRSPTVDRFLNELHEARLVWHPKPRFLAAGAAACLFVAVAAMLASRLTAPDGHPAFTPDPEPTKDRLIAGSDRLPPSPITDGSVAPLGPPAPMLKNGWGHETPSAHEEHSVSRLQSGAIAPGREASAPSAKTQRVAALLAEAERQMATKRLTTPVGDAAFETYQRVLKLIPVNEEALKGIARIKDEYKLWAEADKRRGNWKRAEAGLEKALAIDPEDAMLLVAVRELKGARKRAERESEARGLEPHHLAQREIARSKVRSGTQVNLRARSSADDIRSDDPMARPVSRFEEFERRMGIRR